MTKQEKKYSRIFKEINKQANKGIVDSKRSIHQVNIEKFTLLKPIEITYSNTLLEYER